MNLDWHPANVRNVVETVDQTIAGILNAYPNYVLGNHDDRRLASRLGLAKARAVMLLLLTLRGTPTLYYGDELSRVIHRRSTVSEFFSFISLLPHGFSVEIPMIAKRNET